jgi:enoyl-CoA hydratase
VNLSEVFVDRADDGVVDVVIPGGPLTAPVAAQLSAACESLREDRAVKVVTLRARDGNFCTGAADDLDAFALRPDPAAALASLRSMVVAVISGQCRGEGLEIALAADIKIGASDTVLALDHILDGRVPAWGGTQRLPRAIGTGPATAAALLGHDIDAATAASLGLLYSVTDDIEAERQRLCQLLAGLGPLALELTKEAVHRGSELPLRDGLRLEGDLNHQLAATEDRAEGLQAFFDKRPPDFSGR